MEKKVKIQNTTRSAVTINLKNFNNRVVPVPSQASVFLTEDELSYVMNSSQVFKKGTLKVVNTQDISAEIDTDELISPNALTSEDIVLLLKKNQKDLKEEISKIDSKEKISMILDKAVELDKTVKVIEIIKERQEQLLSI